MSEGAGSGGAPERRPVVLGDPRARRWVERLGLTPHPEGGWFRELHRSAALVEPEDGRMARAALTSIVYLLAHGDHSRWHRVRSDEVWHLLDGEALELFMAPPDLSRVERARLGTGDDARPVHVVPGGWWQCARPAGAFALAGCTVAPGFEYEDFAFLSADPVAAAALAGVAPDLEGLI